MASQLLSGGERCPVRLDLPGINSTLLLATSPDRYNDETYALGALTMSMLRYWGMIGCIALISTMAPPAWAQKSDRKAKAAELGEILGQSCMACHGTRGASTQQAIPIIGGQNDVYISLSMKAYRAGTRPSTIMERIAKGYSTKEIDALAAYFSSQPFTRPPQETDPEKVALGQAVHGKKCKKCHLHNGRDTSDTDSPLLAGQKLQYLRRNMEEILTGKRSIEIKMDAALREITREEVEATLHFYAAQHGELH